MASLRILSLIAVATLALAACADRPTQRAAVDDTTACPSMPSPGYGTMSGITRYHGGGMLTQLKTKC